jgi:hypothetical protein
MLNLHLPVGINSKKPLSKLVHKRVSPERNAALRTSERGSNIYDVRRSVSTRGGKMKFPMPEVGRYKPKDED